MIIFDVVSSVKFSLRLVVDRDQAVRKDEAFVASGVALRRLQKVLWMDVNVWGEGGCGLV